MLHGVSSWFAYHSRSTEQTILRSQQNYYRQTRQFLEVSIIPSVLVVVTFNLDPPKIGYPGDKFFCNTWNHFKKAVPTVVPPGMRLQYIVCC